MVVIDWGGLAVFEGAWEVMVTLVVKRKSRQVFAVETAVEVG